MRKNDYRNNLYEQINNLFLEYEIYETSSFGFLKHRKINQNIILKLYVDGYILSRIDNIDDHILFFETNLNGKDEEYTEKYLDELVFFKELILPKYL